MPDEKSPQQIKQNKSASFWNTGERSWYKIFYTYDRTSIYRLHSHMCQYTGILVGDTWLYLLNSPRQIHILPA